MQATVETAYQGWVIGIVLLVSLLSIIALTRVGFILFWRASPPEEDPINPAYIIYRALPEKAPPRNDTVIYILLAGLVAYVALLHLYCTTPQIPLSKFKIMPCISNLFLN